MRLTVAHSTTYRFDPPVRRLVQSLRLWPSAFNGQRVEAWHVDLRAEGAQTGAGFRDGAGDWVQTGSVSGPVGAVEIAVSGTVETRDLSGVLGGHRERVPPLAYLRATRMIQADQGLVDLAAGALEGREDALDRAHSLSRAVSDTIAYRPGTTSTETTAAEALSAGEGVCQDQAHALIAAAHAGGIPARYVIGYLHSSPGGQAHQASHAWAELWVEGLGWTGFDPANRCCPDEKYIRLGSGHDATLAAPVRSMSTGSSAQRLDVEVRVQEQAQ